MENHKKEALQDMDEKMIIRNGIIPYSSEKCKIHRLKQTEENEPEIKCFLICYAKRLTESKMLWYNSSS